MSTFDAEYLRKVTEDVEIKEGVERAAAMERFRLWCLGFQGVQDQYGPGRVIELLSELERACIEAAKNKKRMYQYTVRIYKFSHNKLDEAPVTAPDFSLFSLATLDNGVDVVEEPFNAHGKELLRILVSRGFDVKFDRLRDQGSLGWRLPVLHISW